MADHMPLKRRQLTASRTITADWTSEAISNFVYRGAIFNINVTALTDTPSVVFTIQESDPTLPTTWTNLLLSAAVTATGVTRLIIYPGAVAVANGVLNQPMPRRFRLFADGTWGGTDGITFTADVTLVP